jgi:hypothetical protein
MNSNNMNFRYENNYMYREINGILVPTDYFDSLPEDLENISLLDKKINFIPNLLRFTNLLTLSLSRCSIKTLPILPNSLQTLIITHTGLEYLPNLDNTSLEYIFCSHNNLTSLSKFPNTSFILNVSYNKLTAITDLPDSLEQIILSNNQIEKIQCFPNNATLINVNYNLLKELPTIPEKTNELMCNHNKLVSMPEIKSNNMWYLCFNCEVHGFFRCEEEGYHESREMKEIIKKINLVNKFKSTYYHLLCRKKLRKWLWEYVREPKIRELYHPDKLNKFIKDVNEDDLEEVLDEWCK